MTLGDLTPAQIAKLTADEKALLLEYLEREFAKQQEKFARFFPDDNILDVSTGRVLFHARKHYRKHIQFFQAGATHPERLFMAANRVGKTEAGAYEVTCHATGKYPHWWRGKRFDRPTEIWACGTSSETLRDIVQTKLFGPWVNVQQGNPLYGGMVPMQDIVHHTRRPHGLTGSLETVWIRHVSGGISTIGLKMYEQGRKSFEGTAKDVIWDDEEPDEGIYTEQLYRTMTTGGIVMVTFTPLQGMSDVVSGYLTPETEAAAEFKVVINAGWDDVPHLDENVKRHLLATTPPFQREARSKGIPQLGAGAIYQFPESELTVSPFEIPRHYRRSLALDAGGSAHPTAIGWFAQDPDTDVAFLYDVYKRESPELAVHFAALDARGKWIPGAADAARVILTETDAEQLILLYQKAGYDLVLANKAVESGIQLVWEAMTAGRLKVFAHCAPWFEEFRLYHRDEKGRIVKRKDDLMDMTRYAFSSGLARGKTPTHDQDRRRSVDERLSRAKGGTWMGR
jgi:phage terminase large subunit-like protein